MEAACYGLPPMPMEINSLSAEEIERLRAIVNAHDRQTGKVREFDLNNPPQAPYTYQPFPKAVYAPDGKQSAIVQNNEELDQYLNAGWSMNVIEPKPAERAPSSSGLAEEEMAEIARIDKTIAEQKKQRK